MNKNRFTPLGMALCVVTGIMLGLFYSNHFSKGRLNIINGGANKLGNLLEAIQNNYVDKVSMDSVIEESIPLILKELDPHSSYISASDAESANQDLKGSFSGIGVVFTVLQDTVRVMQVVKGGPSEKTGLLPGDRIISADDKSLIGKKDTDIMKELKGPKGSKVKLGIIRRKVKNPMNFTVTRGDIPVHSINAVHMLNEKTGYIQVESFGEQTYNEFQVALAELRMEGMKSLVLDLRGNRGGYMHIAVQMVNEFLTKNRLIVYTEGSHSPREDYYSNGQGVFQQLPLVVLVDDGSASASEIFAGAMQDNDRAVIIGRRTFGKGLVQQPMEFKDGSSIRLTIARYYTPSGRCIQKPYTPGHDEEYELELIQRYERGEYFSSDSIKQEGEEYHTTLGRAVYGGGGITPDIFIPEDTTQITTYYRQAVIDGYVRQFTNEYTDANRETLRRFSKYKDLEKYLLKQGLIDKFAQKASEQGLQRRNLMIQKSRILLERAIIGGIIYNVMETNEYRQYLNTTDNTVLKALEVIQEGKAKPKAGERY